MNDGLLVPINTDRDQSIKSLAALGCDRQVAKRIVAQVVDISERTQFGAVLNPHMGRVFWGPRGGYEGGPISISIRKGSHWFAPEGYQADELCRIAGTARNMDRAEKERKAEALKAEQDKDEATLKEKIIEDSASEMEKEFQGRWARARGVQKTTYAV